MCCSVWKGKERAVDSNVSPWMKGGVAFHRVEWGASGDAEPKQGPQGKWHQPPGERSITEGQR